VLSSNDLLQILPLNKQHTPKVFSKYPFLKTAGFSGGSLLTAPFLEFFEIYTKGNDSANYACQNCQYE